MYAVQVKMENLPNDTGPYLFWTEMVLWHKLYHATCGISTKGHSWNHILPRTIDVWNLYIFIRVTGLLLKVQSAMLAKDCSYLSSVVNQPTPPPEAPCWLVGIVYGSVWATLFLFHLKSQDWLNTFKCTCRPDSQRNMRSNALHWTKSVLDYNSGLTIKL